METYRKNFWDNVNRLRENAGLSWSKMALRMGMNYNNLLQSKKNMNLPRIDRLIDFSSALDCTPEDLIKDIFTDR